MKEWSHHYKFLSKFCPSNSFHSLLVLAFEPEFLIWQLGIGHFLGGQDLDTRATLAIANTTRNAGLALVISVLNFTKAEILPTVIVYALISAFAVVIYNKRLRSSLNEVSQ